MANIDLFRQQVIEARKSASSQFGKPTATVPPAWSWFIIGLGVFFAALFLYLSLVDFSRKERVEGRLQYTSAEARIMTTRGGVVEHIFVENGQQIRAGQPLLEIKSENYLSDGAALSEITHSQISRELDLLKARREAAIRSSDLSKFGLLQRKRSLKQRLSTSLGRKTLLEDRLVLNRARWDEALGFLKDGLIVQSDVDIRQSEYNQTQTELTALSRDIEVDIAEIESIEIEVERGDAELTRVLAELDQLASQLGSQIQNASSNVESQIIASIDGFVTALQVREGEPVEAGRLALALVPVDSKLYAEIFLPSRAIAFIEPGQLVRLKYDAFPFQKFGVFEGRVKHVSSTAFLASDLQLQEQRGELLFRIEVELAKQNVNAFGRSVTLQSGMELSADIVLEDRSMLEWALSGMRRS